MAGFEAGGRDELLDPELAQRNRRKKRHEEKRFVKSEDVRSMKFSVPFDGEDVLFYASTFDKKTGTIVRTVDTACFSDIATRHGDEYYGVAPYLRRGTSKFALAFVEELVKLLPPDSGPSFKVFADKERGGHRLNFRLRSFSPVPECLDVECTSHCTFGCQYCAVPGTEIDTPDGRKPIEDIKAGDRVFASDNGRKVVAEVAEIYERDVDEEIVCIELEDGRELRLTANHEVFTKNRGWVQAGELSELDDLEIADYC